MQLPTWPWGKIAVVVVALVVALVVGLVAGYQLGKHHVRAKAKVTLFVVPDAQGPTALGDLTPGNVADVLTEERGFTCAAPEEPGVLGRCVLERADKKAVFTVTVTGTDDRVVAVTTNVEANGVPLAQAVPLWVEVATSFAYTRSAPGAARRWLLATHQTGGLVAIGDAYLQMAKKQDNSVELEIHARGDWPAPQAETVPELARQYAPVLRLSDADVNPEPYVPLSIESFIGASRLTTFRVRHGGTRHEETPRIAVDQSKLRAQDPECLSSRGCYVALDVGDWKNERNLRPSNPAAYAALEKVLNPPPVVYWHAARVAHDGLAIQYWFLYLFNDFGANKHESDWEHVTVYLDAKRVPLAVFYSAHEGGHARYWYSLTEGVNRKGGQPVVYVARGSHANYFIPGNHPATVSRAGFSAEGLDVVPLDLRELSNRGEGDAYELNPLKGSPFTVGFGTGNYLIRGVVRADPRPFPDPRGRKEFTDPLAEFAEAAESP
jgi:hypothetical protein